VTRVHLLATGRVQGVGFRWFVRETARRLDLAGWVMNRPDGSVEVAAEGNAAQIAALRSAVREGPPGARVDAVEELTDNGEALARPFGVQR
jgi:acylphosphatase